LWGQQEPELGPAEQPVKGVRLVIDPGTFGYFREHVQFTPDSKTLAIGSLGFWDVETGQTLDFSWSFLPSPLRGREVGREGILVLPASGTRGERAVGFS
jgi:hypothetical protein